MRKTMMTMAAGLALACATTGASAQQAGQTGQTGPAGPRAQTPFCIQLQSLYAELVSQPPGRRGGTDAVTYSIYRNSTAERLSILAWAGQCDLQPLLSQEQRHMREVMAGSATAGAGAGAAAAEFGGRQ